jgi:hypothetical protein
MRELYALFAVIAAFFAFGGLAQAFSLTVTPANSPTYYFYTGGNGTGYWTAEYTIVPSNNNVQYEIKAADYIIVDSATSVRGTCADVYAGGAPAGSCCRGASSFDCGLDGVGLPVTGSLDSGPVNPEGNTPSSCPYHGFHWFGHAIDYSYRYLTGGVWSSWTPFIFSVVSSGIYGQVCL